MKDRRKPLNRSITIGCVVFIVALCVLLSMANLMLYQNYVFDDYRTYIAEILDYTLSEIDGDDLRTCIETGRESEKYKTTLRFMDRLMDHFKDIHYFYAILPLNTDETGNVMSVLSAERYYDRYVDTEGNLYLGWVSDDEFDAATAALFMEIMNGEGIQYFVEDTEWGVDYTGAIPIRDSAGRAVAVLAVDIDISFINGMIRQYAATNIFIIIAVGAVFIALFLFWSRRNITQPILKLEQSAVGFVDHSRGQRNIEALSFDAPEMHTNNEIKSLSDAVVKMTEDMRHYVSDIIVAEQKAESMKELANRDALTGVRNKTAYVREARQAMIRIKGGEKNIGLAVVDLNFLKRINDTCGHDKGDIAIKNLCKLVCNIFAHSPVFRIGGDEFVILLRGEDSRNIDALVERFNAELARLAADETLQPWERLSAAIGVAFYDDAQDISLETVFNRADAVMYENKRAMKAVRS